MDPKALAKAKQRLKLAELSVARMNQGGDYDTFANEWYTFLVAAKGLLNVLEQGAKTSATSRQWFGESKNFRRNDPLLRYMLCARNDDEHGIESSTRLQSETVTIDFPLGYCHGLMIDTTPDGTPLLRFSDDTDAVIQHTPAKPVLVTVRDRDRSIAHDPPATHLGKEIEPANPYAAADAYLKYLQGFVLEATRLA